MTKILDGKSIAAKLLTEVAAQVKELAFVPTLAVVLVGNDPASQVYVNRKNKAAQEAGIITYSIKLPDTVSENELLEAIYQLNDNPTVDGILVQLPLPSHIRTNMILEAIDPDKDVDGFHPLNVGRLVTHSTHSPTLIPCTPKGIMKLLEASETPLEGADVLVVGSSNIVGRPVSILLSQANATVTVAHKYTKDLREKSKEADIVVVAVGKPNLFHWYDLKEHSTIIDVGINRVDGKIVGDVAYDACIDYVGAITPVPGGVGPMTVVCLLENTLEAALKRRITL